ncbi:MAG: hypothetical protein WC162_06050 [Sphaerochaetaceae bacterium]
METLFKVLLLGMVLVLAFVPNSVFGALFPFVIILTMLLLYGYWYLTYFVRLEDIYKVKPDLKDKIKFNIFCGKLPIENSNDISRCQLLVTETEIFLFQRKKSKERTPDSSCKEIMKIELDSVSSIEFKKVAGARYGFVIFFDENQEVKFMSSRIKSKKKEFCEALKLNE